MPLIPTAIQGLITVKASSKLMSGSKLPHLVSAVSNATSQYILSASIINSTNIALGPGGGTQTGRITALVPSAMSLLMMGKAAAQGLSGRDIKALFDSVSFGVVNSLKATLLQGTIIGAGPGTGTGKITGLVPAGLEALILGQSFFRLISGDKLKAMISAMAFGICNHIMTAGVVTVTNIGVAAGPPVGPVMIPAAPGIGKLV
jgi:hypothetical protein